MWSIIVAITGWIAGWVVFGRPKALARCEAAPPAPGDDPPTRLSVVVPARNEESSLGNLLGDLAAHGPPHTEIIVVDDQSTDATAAIVRSTPGVRLIEAGTRPPGWTGKAWACHTGARAAVAPTLCFIDADVRLGPGAIDAVERSHALRGGLMSIQPWHLTERPYEQVSALFGVVALMGAGTGEQGDHPCAFGPVLMTSTADYDSVGGHAAVRSEVIEDVALAEAYRSAGHPVTIMTGSDLVRFRMYPDGPRSALEGWTKNFASGAANTPLWRLAAIVLWLSAMGSAFGIAWDGATGTRPASLGLGVFAAFVVQLRIMFAPVGRFGWTTSLAYPILMVVFFVVFFRSLWCTVVRREVRWRGRRVPIHTVRSQLVDRPGR